MCGRPIEMGDRKVWAENLSNDGLEWFIKTSITNLHDGFDKEKRLNEIIVCAIELRNRVKEHKA